MRPPSSKLTVIRWRVASAWQRFIKDLLMIALILVGFAAVMGVLAAVKFGVCYYNAKIGYEECFKR
jgi:ActR/RegA family two-component response regulator